MFELDQSATYTWPVPIYTARDGGKHYKQSFDAEFARLPQEEIDEIQLEAARLRRLAEYGSEQTAEQLAKIKEIVSRILVGWSGITDKGEPLPYSEAAKERLLSSGGVASAILGAFADSINTGKAKN